MYVVSIVEDYSDNGWSVHIQASFSKTAIRVYATEMSDRV